MNILFSYDILINNMEFERRYVYNTYQKIYNEFSDSRYKVWDSVKNFINNLPNNSKLLEVGCGNGKNLLLRNDLDVYGCDISDEFVNLCKTRNLNVILNDNTKLSYNDNEFDYTLSVAVIHHMSTEERRINSIRELIRVTKPNGKIFIEVWAMEQGDNSRFKFDKQDLLIPFKDKKTGKTLGDRYYHIFKEGELEKIINNIFNVNIINSFYEKGNWGIIIQKK
jgi:tRNA (uracil-5-)-methyltransferase TRM9